MKFRRRLTYGDFKRYFHNNMEEKDKHDFEKRMMQDVFEQEAFDGLSGLSEEELEGDMKELKSSIENRTRRQRRFVPYWFRYAAGILLLVGIGVGYYILEDPFKQEVVVREPAEAVSGKGSENLSSEEASQLPPNGINKAGDEDGNTPEKGVAAGPGENLGRNDTETPEVSDKEAVSTRQEKKGLSASPEKQQPNMSENRDDEEGSELDNDCLKASKAGYQPQAINVEQDTNVVVMLEPASPRQNHTRVKYTKHDFMKARKEKLTKQGNSGPKPPNGLTPDEYRDEILNRIDEDALSEFPGKQRVKVEIAIDENGLPTEFHFRSFPDSVFIREIERAVKEVGPWQPATRQGRRVPSEVMMNLEVEVKKKPEVRDQRTEDRDQRSEIRGQRQGQGLGHRAKG